MLNKQQQKAVNLTKGRILVLAGAGSGKTKVLIHRIAHLVNDLKIKPSSILGLTFTNKAANEMKTRLFSLIGEKKAKDVFLSTFHSFCLTILRKDAKELGYNTNFSIYDEKDMQRLVKQTIKDNFLGDENEPSVYSILEIISKLKNQNLPIDEFAFEDKEIKSLIKDLYPKIHATLKVYNAIDFDSMLTLTLELFQNKKVLSYYQEKFKYILIDEYQDTNIVQCQIAEKLAEKHKNLFVVGDDDQSIYGWRGSCIKNILEFKADHVVKLEQNYRSTKTILNAANFVIKNNKFRHQKNLFSEKSEDEKILLFHTPNETEEANTIVNKIIALKEEKNLQWRDIAILYRSNALSRNIEMALINAIYQKNNNWVKSIPYEIRSGIEFAKRSEIKDLLAFLRFINNPKDLEALFRIINVPRRKISDKTIENLKNISKKTNKSIWDILQKIKDKEIAKNFTSATVHSIENFVNIIKEARLRFSKNKLSESFEWFIYKINYKKAIEEEVKSEKARHIKWENALECINAIAQYEESEQNPTLNDFIANTLLFKENLYKSNSNDDRLQLMTFHSSKGLEFEACFLIALEDHIIPHEKSLFQTSLEEERRLMYVAITRAKKYLIMSMARTRRRIIKLKASNPSRFLFEIPKECLKIYSYRDL